MEGSTEYVRFEDSSGSEHALPLLSSGEISNRYRVEDLDGFLARVYAYYQGKGFACTVLSSFFNLLIFLWIITFIALLLEFFDVWTLSFQFEPRIPTNPLFYLFVLIFFAFWLWQVAMVVISLPKLLEMRSFFSKQLDITEDMLQVVEWSSVVDRLVAMQGLCIVKDSLTPLDITHRIMRKENFLIAMVNKNVLALYFPCCYNRLLITKTLEWAISLALFNFLFKNYDLAHNFSEAKHDRVMKEKLVYDLQKRFVLIGIVSLMLSPALFLFLIVYFGLRYGEEIRSKPSMLSTRQWSRMARWRMREFNELPHYFQARLNRAYDPAHAYVSQFRSNVAVIVARFVSFIAGSIFVVLLLLSFLQDDILDENVFLGRSGLWYIGVCGTILAVSRAMIPKETEVFNPEACFDQVYEHTHYRPKHWRNRCRAKKVQKEFSSMFEYRIAGFFEEMLSIFYAPFILMFSMPQCAEDVILFVADNTVHIDGVGDVCSFADFRFKEHGNKKYGAPESAGKLSQSKQGKMEKSFVNFAATYRSYQPTEEGQQLEQSLSNFLLENAGALQSASHSAENSLCESLRRSAMSRVGGAEGAGEAQSVLSSVLDLNEGQISAVQDAFYEIETMQCSIFDSTARQV